MAKAQRKSPKHKKPSRAGVAAAVFTATLTITLLSFISLELAMISFGLFALGAIVYSEGRRRGFWEQAASFTFKRLKDEQESLAMSIADHDRELMILQNQMKVTMARVEEIRKNKTKMQSADEPYSKAAQLDIEMDSAFDQSADRIPLALRAAQTLDRPPDPAPAPETEFDGVSDTIVQELLRMAVSKERVDVFVQPIMRLPQRQKRFYEMFARIRARPGQYIPAARYMQMAEQDNLHNTIDHLLLLHCLKTIESSAHIKNATPFFINITGDTLKNKPFMQRLLAFVSKNRALAPRLIFEIRQSDFEDLHPALLEVLKGLGTLGCSFSLDHVQSLDFDISELQRFKVRFIKIDKAQLMAHSGMAQIMRAKGKLEANGIGVIVQKIETEDDMRDLLDYDIHYGQGYLFGKPDLQGAYGKTERARRSGAIG